MQTALHITALVDQLKREAIGAVITATEFYKKERAAYFILKGDKTRLALGFVYHLAGSGTFLVPASKLEISTREKPWPVFDLEGAVITGAEQFGFDRIFSLHLEKEGRRSTVVVECLGPNGNVWLLDGDGIRLGTLRKREYAAREKYQPAPLRGKLNPFELAASQLKEIISKGGGQSLMVIIEKNVLGLNRTLAKEVLTRAKLEFVPAESLDDAALERLVKTVRDVAALFRTGDTGCLYHVAGSVEVYPFKLSCAEDTAEKFTTLSLAIMAMTARRQAMTEQSVAEENIRDAVHKMVARLQKRLSKLEDDIRAASGYKEYKRFGELIQINMGRLKRGITELVADDIYHEPHQTVAIKLEPALVPSENAEAYFKKYRKGKEGLDLLVRRHEVTAQEIAQWAEISTALAIDYESASRKYREEVASLVPKEGVRQAAPPRLPYREYALKSGVRIYVGRDGADNDRTTFEFAKPFELWFHAQQCPGSHVVMKFPNKSFVPAKSEIHEAASIAAHFSKAKSDGLVAVVYAERRYVRKPRKAKPGLVTVEREKSIMVAPQKPQGE